MDVAHDTGHAARPLAGIDDDVAGAIARALPPPLVDVDVLITGARHPGGNERIHLGPDGGVVDDAREAVPRRPSHRRSRYGDLVGCHRRIGGAARACYASTRDEHPCSHTHPETHVFLLPPT